MAVVLLLTVDPGSQDQYDALDARIEESMKVAGGPPPGLMVHVVYPSGDGFVMADVWRTESEGLHFLHHVVRPRMDELGLSTQEPQVLPLWSLARP